MIINGAMIYNKKKVRIVKNTLKNSRRKDKMGNRALYYENRLVDDNGNEYHIFNHILDIWSFRGGPEIDIKNPIDPTVDHLDENGLNNASWNLKWAERDDNARRSSVGRRSHHTIITEEMAEAICYELKYGDIFKTLYDIAQEFGVSYCIVGNIYYLRRWKDISTKYAPFPKRKIGKPKKEKVNNEQ